MISDSRIRPARRASVLASAAIGAVLLLGLSACAPVTAADSELDTGAQMSPLDWRQKVDDCMLTAGFDIRTPAVAEGESSEAIDTSQFDMVKFDKAYSACIATIGDAPVDENQPSDEEIFDFQLVFAACMREAGYDYPDPVKGNNMSPALGPEVDTDVVDTCSAKAQEQAQESSK